MGAIFILSLPFIIAALALVWVLFFDKFETGLKE
jgi:hypothetical protein